MLSALHVGDDDLLASAREGHDHFLTILPAKLLNHGRGDNNAVASFANSGNSANLGLGHGRIQEGSKKEIRSDVRK